MAERTNVHQDEDAYWRSAKEFVRLLIAELNRTLKQNRVATKKRKQICTAFVFEFCEFLDQQWFQPGGKTEYPLLCFSRKFFDIDLPIELSEVNFPHKSVELHAMVHDEIEWFFNEVKENRKSIKTGSFGEETPGTNEEIQEPSIIIPPCHVCGGSGHCFCIRKGPGTSEDCPRCGGTGQCKHCRGTGKSFHP